MKYIIAIVIIVLALLGANGIYVVGQGHAVVLTQLGHVQATHIGPGLHFKIPFLQHVTYYDTRTIVLQSAPKDYKTAGGEPVRVGFFVRWQVADPDVYFNATSGDELQATRQMTPVIRTALRAQIAKRHLSELLAADGGTIDTQLRNAVAPTLRKRLGVSIMDIGIRRVLPPDDALPAVYKRMSAEAGAKASAIRAKGKAAAAAIHAKGQAADNVVLAKANKAAAAKRGAGEAAAARIYAAAAAKDPRFFRYWSGLNAWRESFANGGAVVVLDKTSPFMQAVSSGASAGKH